LSAAAAAAVFTLSSYNQGRHPPCRYETKKNRKRQKKTKLNKRNKTTIIQQLEHKLVCHSKQHVGRLGCWKHEDTGDFEQEQSNTKNWRVSFCCVIVYLLALIYSFYTSL